MANAFDRKNQSKSPQQAPSNPNPAPSPQTIPTGQALALPSHKKVIANSALTSARRDLEEISLGYERIEDAIVTHAINCEERTRANVAARLNAYWDEQGTADFFDLGAELNLLTSVQPQRSYLSASQETVAVEVLPDEQLV
jgi:hypothetical protein